MEQKQATINCWVKKLTKGFSLFFNSHNFFQCSSRYQGLTNCLATGVSLWLAHSIVKCKKNIFTDSVPTKWTTLLFGLSLLFQKGTEHRPLIYDSRKLNGFFFLIWLRTKSFTFLHDLSAKTAGSAVMSASICLLPGNLRETRCLRKFFATAAFCLDVHGLLTRWLLSSCPRLTVWLRK